MGDRRTDAIRVIARCLLEVSIGGQIPTTAELGRLAGVGAGTVQSALQGLEEAGSIVTTSHGVQGRRLTSRDAVALWQATGQPLLTGSMPHPQSREFAGLATALARAADSRDLRLRLLFRQGSRARLQALHEGRTDFVVLSQGAARNAEGIRYIPLTSHTYYGEDTVVVITPSGEAPRYAGIVPVDLDSYDHQFLSRAEFAECQLVHIPYPLIPERIANREFHSAVWHVTSTSNLTVAGALSIHPLKYPDQLVQEPLSVATIAWREGDAAVSSLLEEIVELEEIQATQQEVVGGLIAPQY